MKPVGIAVVGLGRMGRVHALNAARHVPGACLAAVCDRDERFVMHISTHA